MKPWEPYLSESDLAVIEKGRFGRRMGLGVAPCVVAIDCQKYMVGEEGNDDAWPSSCGEVGRAAMKQARVLIEVAQSLAIPVFFTRFEIAPDGRDMGVYRRKRDLLDSAHWCLENSVGAELADGLRPSDNDVVFIKKKPSAFHGTPLTGYLIDRGIDTVIVVGGATSNCVRASVLDAASYNFRTIVAEDAVFDRLPISHAISLFDMDRQFADVTPVEEIVATLSRPQ